MARRVVGSIAMACAGPATAPRTQACRDHPRGVSDVSTRAYSIACTLLRRSASYASMTPPTVATSSASDHANFVGPVLTHYDTCSDLVYSDGVRRVLNRHAAHRLCGMVDVATERLTALVT